MRRLALLLLVAFPLFADVYEIRSTRYVLSVDVEDDAYDVSVTDLAADATIASERLKRSQDEVTAVIENDDVRMHVRIRELARRLTAGLRVERKDTVLEQLNATWLTEPYVQPYRVGGAVSAPIVTHRVDPVYTEEAKEAKVSGIVIVETVIDRTGRVTGTKVLKPLPFGLDRAAVDAVRQWQFKPGMLAGEPVDVIFNLTVSFRLESSN